MHVDREGMHQQFARELPLLHDLLQYRDNALSVRRTIHNPECKTYTA